MKQQMKITVRIDILYVNINIYIWNLELMLSNNKQFKDIETFEFRDGCSTFENWNYNIYIENNNEVESTFVHELNHTVFRILNYFWIKHTEDTDELYSYIIEYVYKEFFKRYNKYIDKK